MQYRNRMTQFLILGSLLSLFTGITASATAQGWFAQKPQIEGFQQIIPRGRIASIDNPEFVSADRALIPDNAWILGFKMDGQAYVYDLNLLNAHEIVNHNVGNTPVAAVW